MPQPPYKVTRKLQAKVMRLVAYGMGERGIAHTLGIDRKTLVTHYAHELEVGRAKCVAEINELLWQAADKGSVAAMKQLADKAHGEGLRLIPLGGKKERQAEAAKVAGMGTEWEADLMRVMPQGDDKPN